LANYRSAKEAVQKWLTFVFVVASIMKDLLTQLDLVDYSRFPCNQLNHYNYLQLFTIMLSKVGVYLFTRSAKEAKLESLGLLGFAVPRGMKREGGG
jgi:hypothetical protein